MYRPEKPKGKNSAHIVVSVLCRKVHDVSVWHCGHGDEVNLAVRPLGKNRLTLFVMVSGARFDDA